MTLQEGLPPLGSLDSLVVACVRSTALHETALAPYAVWGGILMTTGAALWVATALFKLALGYSLHCWATRYNRYYDEHHGSKFFRAKGT